MSDDRPIPYRLAGDRAGISQLDSAALVAAARGLVLLYRPDDHRRPWRWLASPPRRRRAERRTGASR